MCLGLVVEAGLFCRSVVGTNMIISLFVTCTVACMPTERVGICVSELCLSVSVCGERGSRCGVELSNADAEVVSVHFCSVCCCLWVMGLIAVQALLLLSV